MAKEWYDQFIDECPLTKKHITELTDKRGFSEEIVGQLRFRSGGAHALQAGYIPRVDRAVLSSDRIIIPYLDKSGSIIHLRPHKLGIKGEGIRLYVPWPLMNGAMGDVLVIAESEFKAAASVALGIPAVGVPGISSFIGKKFDELKAFLKHHDVRKVVICFDNEIKDNPKFTNFKPDYQKRYDTQFYAYIMAEMIRREGYESSIATLPKEWMVDGKIDIDGALAMKKTKEEYLKVINAAVSPIKYKSSWGVKRQHMSFMERRVERHFYRKPIGIVDGCYYDISKTREWRKLSNFHIKVPYTMHTGSDDGVVRMCQFKSNYGDSCVTKFSADNIATKTMFQKWAYQNGDYEFNGTQKDLDNIIHHIIISQDGRIVKAIRKMGYCEDEDFWVFGNCLITNSGDVIQQDENGIFWVDETGYSIDSPSKGITLPTLNFESNITAKEVCDRLGSVIGSNQARLIIGWVCAVAFMPEIVKKYHFFPFTFLFGKTGEGKSTIGRWTNAMLGFNYEGYNVADTSNVAMTRTMEYFSCLPVWFDEYRNSPEVIKKQGLMRSAYDRQGVLKGVKKSFGLNTFDVNSTIFISGQEFPHDAALNNRCVSVMISKRDRDESQKYWFESNINNISCVFFNIIKRRNELKDEYLRKVDEYIAAFDKDQNNLDARIKAHYSMFSAGYSLLTDDETLGIYNKWLADYVQQVGVEKESQHILNKFYDDWQVLNERGDIKDSWFKVMPDGNFYFWYKGFYDAWESLYQKRNKGTPSNFSVMLKYIKDEPYYVGMKRIRINKNQFRCIIFNGNTMPHDVKEFSEKG